MDIKAKIEEITEKIKNDDCLRERFKKDPIKAIEDLLGVDLPEDTIKKIVEGIKSKIDLDTVMGKLDSDGDGKLNLNDAKKALGGLFNKLK